MRNRRSDIDWPMHWAIMLPALTVPGWFDRTVFRHMGWTSIPASIGVGIAAALIGMAVLLVCRRLRWRHDSPSPD
jgi:hypothetical protein